MAPSPLVQPRLWTVLTPKWRSALARARQKQTSAGKVVLLAVIGLAFWMGVFGIAFRVLRYFRGVEDIGNLLAGKVLGVILLVQALTVALSSGRMPSRELADGALILIGGTLMLSPGFVTDAVGILLILPFTRPFARAALTRVVSRRLLTATRPGPGSQGPVVRGEVVDE